MRALQRPLDDGVGAGLAVAMALGHWSGVRPVTNKPSRCEPKPLLWMAGQTWY